VNWGFVLRIASREARTTRRRMAVYASAIAIGVAALVAIDSFRASVDRNIELQSRVLLGADLELSSRAPFEARTAALERELRELGAETAQVTRFSSMALAEPSGQTRLVWVQAIDPNFPLYGGLVTEPADAWQDSTREPIAVVDPAALLQLNLEVGQSLRLGEVRFRVAGTVTRAPGSIGMRESVAPRVFIPSAYLDSTRLMQVGSLARYSRYFRLPEARPLAAALKRHREELHTNRVRAETVGEYADELSEDLGRLTRFLGLVGLVALLLGGVGVATGVHVFVRERLQAAAVLRCLGASQREILAIYLLQALALGGLGSSLGALLGIGIQAWLPDLVREFLPLEVSFELDFGSVAAGILLGLWVTLLFALEPLLKIRRVSPLQALRRDFEAAHSPATNPGPSGWVRIRLERLGLVLLGAISLVAISIWQAPSLQTGLYFATGLGLCLAVLSLCAGALMKLTKRSLPRGAPYWLRQGVANLFRPQNQTHTVTLSIGLGVLLLAALHVVQSDLLSQLDLGQQAGRPNIAIFDIQLDQRERVRELLSRHGAQVQEETPIVPARIREVVGSGSSDPNASGPDRGRQWALRREYRLTYRDQPSESEELIEGRWWPAQSPRADGLVRVSLEQDLARELGVGVGDRVVWEIQGVPIESVVENLRRVDWARFRTNFFAVFESGPLESAPQSFVVLGRIDDDLTRAEFQRDLVLALPNISVLDATAILNSLDSLLSRVALAIRFMALFAMASGLLILVGSLATSRYQRARESVLLRTLGAPASIVRRILATEYFALGALAGIAGAGLAAGVGWLLLWSLFELNTDLPVTDLLAISIGTALATTAVGLSYGRAALRQTPLAGLRNLGA